MRETPGRIRWLAVIVGYLVDFVLSAFISLIAALFGPRLVNEISFHSLAAALTAVLLVVSTGIGGWLAARLAKGEYTLHGALVGGVGIMYLLMQSLFGSPLTLIVIVLQCIAVGAGALGGWLSRWIPARQER